VQRLYSMFPNCWPGRGLLLLRAVACSLTAYQAIAAAFGPIPLDVRIQQIAAMIYTFLLLIGLFTPLAAIALSLCEVWAVFSNVAQWPLAVALGGIGFALAMLGPGSISIDALLFGRKRIDWTDSDSI
jgi:putative oxidoreductase